MQSKTGTTHASHVSHIRGIAIALAAGTLILGALSTAQAAEKPPAWADSLDTACTDCHMRQIVDESEKGAAGEGAPLICQHADLACTDCHNDEATLAKMHEDVEEGQRIPKTLKRTSVPNEVCLGCHEAGGAKKDAGDANTQAATAEKPSAPAAPAAPAVPQGVTVKDANGLQVDVHALPANSDHATVTCGDCHAMHTGKSAEKTAPKVCATCHHKDVFECHTCH